MSLNWGSLPQDLLAKVNQILMDLKAHDEATYQHCVRVSQMSRFLAEQADLNSYQQLLAQMSGLLHDVGKMMIPIEVLHKPARLNEDEFEMVKEHPIRSAELIEPLESSSFFREVQVAVLHHHERIDGQGYPYGLSGDQVPFIARVILIVDTVDAMSVSRPYRKGLPMDVVYRELERCAGTQFDEDLVKIFVEAHKKTFHEEGNKVISFPNKKIVA